MNRQRALSAFALLAALLVLLLLGNICIGSTPIPPAADLGILLGHGGNATWASIVWDIRLPRILAAALLGGALSVSGFLLQTFFANPIAGPFVLGISSGANLTVALALIVYGVLFILLENSGMTDHPAVTKVGRISLKTAFFIGLFQVLALIPGTSRSGSTMLGAMML